MSNADREKWDQRYREGAYVDRPHASALLADWLDVLPRGRALDVACGAGRNAVALAAAGYQVDAVDISPVGLSRGRAVAEARNLTDIQWMEADLESPHWLDSLEGRPPYQVIVWVRYVNPHLMPQLKPLLAEDGVLLVEQHLSTEGIARAGEIAGPSGARFRLPSQELLHSADGLQVVHYHEGLIRDPDQRTAALARLVARRRNAGTQHPAL